MATTKSDEEFSVSYGFEFSASVNILNGDKVFFLSAEEAENGNYGFTDNAARSANYGNLVRSWWLRSHVADNTVYAGYVTGSLGVDFLDVKDDLTARPAFNLNLNSVLFTSAAVGGKTDAAADGNLTAVTDYAGNEWKLTLKDSSRSFSANVNGQTSAYASAGGSVQITYSGEQTGENEYVSLLLCDSNDNVLYYGNIAQGSASGTASVTIPADLAFGNYTLKVFSEQCNGDKKTDYASDFQNISLTVIPKAYITIVDANGNKVPITSSNCTDVLGDGTVSYTPPIVDSTKTYTPVEIERAVLGEPVEGLQPAVLTLNNANLQQIYFENFSQPSGAKTMAQLLSIPTVKLEGESTITNPNEYQAGIRVYRGMIITGDGSLTVNTARNAILYDGDGLFLQKSGTVTLNDKSRGIYQGNPVNICFWGGKLTIQAGNAEDQGSGAIAMFEGFSMADNASLLLGDFAETNCIRITPPEGDERWQDAIIRQWRTVDSENDMPHYLQLTSTYTVTLNAGGGTINSGNVIDIPTARVQRCQQRTI